jgi:hypothetical protein
MSPDDAFRKLCLSAFEFLRRSVAEFDKDPKFALAHFSTGLELLLKARLLNEHWSLVVLSKPDLKKFRSGESTTVGITEAMDRLDSVVGEPVPKDARAAFEKVARHRNRVMHFFLEVGDQDREKLTREVAQDLYIGWYYLRERTQAWSGILEDFQKELRALDSTMQRTKAYLKVLFEKLKPALDQKRRAGVEIGACPSCNFEAAVVENIADQIFVQRCQVCTLCIPILRFECSECETQHEVSGWHHFQPVQCPCGEHITMKELHEWLDTSSEDYTNPGPPINCAECQGAGTVVLHGELYVCVQCAEHSQNAPQCGWCNECQIGGGDLEDSYLTGCEFCDGRGYDD